ncbi:hypothetical protein FJZ53_02610 [Candidatus Woesearchaeota archaeon]|nr:hypothetical protein [Candidatus Woesearchaeota archaeon]
MKLPDTFVPEKNLETDIDRLLSNKKKFYQPYSTSLDNLIVSDQLSVETIYFDESLRKIQEAGFERHLLPWESFTIILGYIDGKIKNEFHAAAKDMASSFGCTEWLSMAVKRDRDVLVCYANPKNLVWDDSSKIYKPDGILSFDPALSTEISIKGVPSEEWVDLKRLSEDFVKYFYTRKFEELPDEINSNDDYAQIFLPAEGGIWPVGRGANWLKYSLSTSTCLKRISRGVKLKK